MPGIDRLASRVDREREDRGDYGQARFAGSQGSPILSIDRTLVPICSHREGAFLTPSSRRSRSIFAPQRRLALVVRIQVLVLSCGGLPQADRQA
jgi:hypothetical protein